MPVDYASGTVAYLVFVICSTGNIFPISAGTCSGGYRHFAEVARVTWSDFQRLQDLPAEILRQKAKLQRLKDSAGVKSPRWGAMPHGSGTHDKIGDLVPGIVDAEDELIRLEKEQETIRWRFGSWIDQQSDIKAQVILSMRYIERMSWEQIADECTGCGDPTTDSAARKYATRYLKQHLAKETENNGQESR